MYAAQIGATVGEGGASTGPGAVRVTLGVEQVLGEADDGIFAVFRTPGQAGIDLIKRRRLVVRPVEDAAVLGPAP